MESWFDGGLPLVSLDSDVRLAREISSRLYRNAIARCLFPWGEMVSYSTGLILGARGDFTAYLLCSSRLAGLQLDIENSASLEVSRPLLLPVGCLLAELARSGGVHKFR
jgi:hypothetical protein